jgi:hypothetical protein
MGVMDMIAKIKEALKAGEAKKTKETSRINLDAELDMVRAKIEADALARIKEEARAASAAKGG